MKTLIISDTHLTHRFDQRKFAYLKKLFESVDEIIINGDFWDGLSTTFERFVNSEWKQLFPLLKQKKAVYVYGNHDFKHMADERVNLFSVRQGEEHFLTTNLHRLIIRHGHQYTFSIQEKIRGTFVLKLLNNLYELTEFLALKTLGKNFFKYSLYKSFNSAIFAFAKSNLKENEILVSGHSHAVVFNPKQKYINTGFIRHGLAQYLLIENYRVRLVEENY